MHTVKSALEELLLSMDRVDAQVIMADVLGVNRSWIAANPMRILTETQDAKIEMLAAQRAMGRPVAYLVDRREFYGRDFALDSAVLIPRPETETLVEAALIRLPPPSTRRAAPPCVLDLGTGSGAVAVTIACQRPDARIVATDASEAALRVARTNGERHACADRIELVRGSWYEGVQGRRFELIVSNPPYIARDDPHLSRGDLRFEPRSALTDESADGLGSIRAIVAGAADHLTPGGWLLFEHGHDQRDAARKLLADAGFLDGFSIDDLGGIPRVAGGRIEE
jgi:release factor glutamine methyltransferase